MKKPENIRGFTYVTRRVRGMEDEENKFFRYQVAIFPPGTTTFPERVAYLPLPYLIPRFVKRHVMLRSRGLSPSEARFENKTRMEKELWESRKID